jgi:hypothetical protein
VFWLKSKAFLANFKEDIEFRVGLRRQIKEMRSFKMIIYQSNRAYLQKSNLNISNKYLIFE